jgi:predicted dehydrogenase
MAYASNPLERESFPETLVFVEGDAGSVELSPGCILRTTTRQGTLLRNVSPPFYAWADPRYAVVHSSIVDCNANLLRALQGGPAAETTGEDNLRTVRLVFAAYDSAARGKAISLI